jgi:L-iditol 2-dehydrogenase
MSKPASQSLTYHVNSDIVGGDQMEPTVRTAPSGKAQTECPGPTSTGNIALPRCGNSDRTMQALMKTRAGEGNVELVTVPEPECPADGVKVEVRYTGICGTDLHVYHDTFRSYPPVVLGHEFSGIVTEAGSAVERVKPGARVAVLGSTAVMCGECEHCRQGYYMFCRKRRGMGHGVNGSFTRYVVVRPDQVYLLPESVSLEDGAVCEPFASAVQAVEELAPCHAGDVALVSGPGPIGLLCAMLLVSRGCRVLVAGTERDGIRLQVAGRLGIDCTIDIGREDLQTVVAEITHGRGVDFAVEAAGAESSAAACLHALRNQGTYIQVGIHGKGVRFPLDLVLYKQVRLYGSLGHSLITWDRVMRIVEHGKVNLRAVVTHVMPLSRWREAFELCETKQAVKVLLHSDELQP